MSTTNTALATQNEWSTQLQPLQESVTEETNSRAEALLSLKIVSINDIKGVEQVKAGIAEMVKAKKQVENIRSGLKRGVIDYGKLIDSTAKDVSETINKAEYYLKGEIKRIEDEIENVRRAEVERQREFIRSRTNKLFSLGVAYNGVMYSAGNLSHGEAWIETATEEEFEKFCEGIAAEVKREKADKQELEQLRQQKEQQEKAAPTATISQEIDFDTPPTIIVGYADSKPTAVLSETAATELIKSTPEQRAVEHMINISTPMVKAFQAYLNMPTYDNKEASIIAISEYREALKEARRKSF
jgi:hypothetical protein